MKKQLRTMAGWGLAILPLLVELAPARAEIIGFDHLTNWRYNQGDSGSPPALLAGDGIQFTSGPNNRRSLWYNEPQNITEFEASFTFRAGSISPSVARQGVTLTLQNSPAGLGALGSGGSGLAYAGIGNSAAITIETDTGPALTYSGYFTNGVMGGGSVSTSPVNAFNFRDIDVTLSYSGSVLSVTMVDGSNVFTRNHFVGSLASVLGGPTAYVGITGASSNTLGSGGGASFFLADFRYSAIPEPATLSLLGLAALATLRPRRD